MPTGSGTRGALAALPSFTSVAYFTGPLAAFIAWSKQKAGGSPPALPDPNMLLSSWRFVDRHLLQLSLLIFTLATVLPSRSTSATSFHFSRPDACRSRGSRRHPRRRQQLCHSIQQQFADLADALVLVVSDLEADDLLAFIEPSALRIGVPTPMVVPFRCCGGGWGASWL